MTGAADGTKLALHSLLIVTSEAEEGREDEFNDWYTHIHLHDVMRMPGSFAAQRWKLSRSVQSRYVQYVGPWQSWLTIYELDDTEKDILGTIDVCFTDALPISSAIVTGCTEDYYYEPAERGKSAIETFAARGGDILTIRMNAKDGAGDDFARWFQETALPRTRAIPGIIDGDLYRATEMQLMDSRATFEFTAIYHVSDPIAARTGLDQYLVEPDAIVRCPLVERAGVRIAFYTPIIERFTAEHAFNLTPDEQAVEDRVRASLKGRTHVRGTGPVGFADPATIG